MSSLVDPSKKSSPVAVITGAGQGIGRAIAHKLASEGYSLALGDIASNQGRLKEVADECTEIYKNTLAHGAEPKLYYGPCDVTAEPQVQALVQAAVDDLGGIDVMVANAGIYRVAPLLEMEDELFDQVYTVNTASPNKGAYCSSKFAVRALTQTAALEWGRHNITVNAYAPGPTDTDMWNKDVLGGITGGNQAQQLIVDRLATGNISSPDEIAGLVSFLVSPAARNITGQAISIDGGLIMQ
ncbi:Enoyl-(Acyl carrier protein) reductase [Rhizoctonia solani]|uniref:Enoyl-(Acyl carrier protein) reductase n=1 Tax=Rhizoctonia solani TaxID=456999 RepID=A0A8H8SYQ9_9AGAM|nr:Enoyl-(Acyl carrier protein) reductase [Rhizoctonia solani]QRW21598.1 Enoyl-(Acyl carrier protein) reductase [Rhizoctonia solani]